MGLGFILCVAPPQDHGVSISEGEGAGKGMEHGGVEEQRCKELELTRS